MDKISLVLSGLLGVAMVILIAPGILRLNQGKALRNMALWVAIFLGLALAYKAVGPGRMEALQQAAVSTGLTQESGDKDDSGAAQEQAPDIEQGYTPPRE